MVSRVFGDVDIDEDGVINVERLDQIFAEVIVFRRYGLAPLDVGDVVSRVVIHIFFFIFWIQQLLCS